MTNKPHDEGTNTFTGGSRGNREGTKGSHLHSHNAADYQWRAWERQKRQAAGPSAVMLPSAGGSVPMRAARSELVSALRRSRCPKTEDSLIYSSSCY